MTKAENTDFFEHFRLSSRNQENHNFFSQALQVHIEPPNGERRGKIN